MWVTILTVAAFCLHMSYIFQRGRYFYLHSIFLIPLYAAVFFIDHNAHFVVPGLEPDSANDAFKLLPIYLNVVYLVLRFKPQPLPRLSFSVVAVNAYFVYNLALSLVYCIYHSSGLPFFYISFSAPLFAIFYNSRNVTEEIAEFDRAGALDRWLLQIYFIGFLFIYAASIYYSIRSAITTSLIDSRGVGSIFASTSALVYCLLYAPLLATLTKTKWPYVATIALGVTSLSKTALLLVPAFGIQLFRRMRKNIVKYGVLYAIAATLVIALVPVATPPTLMAEWQSKFSLASDQTILSKSYETRVDIYEDALKTIHDFPFGIGVGNFERYSTEGYKDAHNFAITTVMESGLLFGALLVVAFYIAFARTMFQVLKGRFGFNHFSFLSLFLVYTTAAGVLLTTGDSGSSAVYYTPFYGVVIFLLMNLARERRVTVRSVRRVERHGVTAAHGSSSLSGAPSPLYRAEIPAP